MVVFLFPQPAKAVILDGVAEVLTSILLPIITLLGKLVTVLIKLLINVVQYNDFINSPAVSKGWIIIRDIFNMLFIIVLLVIAFATVLKIERYSYKKLLGGLLLAAVLVNFSKLICGIIIDAAQILTLTFVSAFKDVGEGNMAELLGLRHLLVYSRSAESLDIAGQTLGATFLAIIMLTVCLVVTGIIVLIFVFRIIVLWFLVLLLSLIHISEPTRPLFLSYAVFCLKKKTF
mgnify:CR=1 FL=1